MVTTQPPARRWRPARRRRRRVLTAFDADDRRRELERAVTGGFAATSPLVDSGWVLVAATAGDVLVIRRGADGKSCGRSRSARHGGAAVYRSRRRLLLALRSSRRALALLIGEPRWERTLPGKPGELLVLDDRLFVGADDKFFYCLNTKQRQESLAPRGRRQARRRAPAVDEKHVYYVALDNILWALDRNGGLAAVEGRDLPVRPVGRPARARHDRRRGRRRGRGVRLSGRRRRAARQGVVLRGPRRAAAVLVGPNPVLSGIAL